MFANKTASKQKTNLPVRCKNTLKWTKVCQFIQTQLLCENLKGSTWSHYDRVLKFTYNYFIHYYYLNIGVFSEIFNNIYSKNIELARGQSE